MFTFYGWQNLSALAGRLWIPLVRVDTEFLTWSPCIKNLLARRVGIFIAEAEHVLVRVWGKEWFCLFYETLYFLQSACETLMTWDNIHKKYEIKYVQNDDIHHLYLWSKPVDNMLLPKSLSLLDWHSKIDGVPPSRKFERRKCEIPKLHRHKLWADSSVLFCHQDVSLNESRVFWNFLHFAIKIAHVSHF